MGAQLGIPATSSLAHNLWKVTSLRAPLLIKTMKLKQSVARTSHNICSPRGPCTDQPLPGRGRGRRQPGTESGTYM